MHAWIAVRTKRTVLAPQRPRVAPLIESSRAFGRGLLFGVAQYLREHGPWSIFLQEEILRVRLNRARQLLAETDFPLWTIAEKIGLEHTEYLNVIFKKKTGLTPGQFRAQARGRSWREKQPDPVTD